MAIFSSLLVAAKINSFESWQLEWLAFIAALSVGLLNGFDIGSISNRLRNAWRILNTAIIKYESSSNFSIGNLIMAHEEGEKIIGDVKEDPKG